MSSKGLRPPKISLGWGNPVNGWLDKTQNMHIYLVVVLFKSEQYFEKLLIIS